MRVRLFTLYFRLPFTILLCWPLLSTAAPEVVVSIKPVHSLIAGVMAGIGTPDLLLHSGRTPHNVNLAPSDVRKLSRADRVFWVGPALEAPLAKILRATIDESKVVALLTVPGMALLPVRESGVWDSHAHDHNGGGNGEHHALIPADWGDSSHTPNVNPHIWLSPANASRILRLAVADLSLIDPENADRYRRNGELLLRRIDALDSALRERLSGIREVPYIVFHDAYAYFEQHYGLNAVGSVTLSPEHTPGARRIHQLRTKINSLEARCVFSEPQFEPKLVHVLLQGSAARAGTLDPLGAALPAGPDAYFLMMNNLAEALVNCLKQGG